MSPGADFCRLLGLALAAGILPASTGAAESPSSATIEGRIEEVRESFPPQLVLKTGKDEFEIAVSEDAVIEELGKKHGYGVLRRGKIVRIEGKWTSRRSLTAKRIQVLEEVVGRILDLRDSPQRLIVAREGREHVVDLVKGTSIDDPQGKKIRLENLRRDMKVRVRFYREYSRRTKKTFLKASSVKVLEVRTMKETIEGRITQVRESFPPQLVLETDEGELDIAVSEDTAIEQNGKKCGYEALRPGKVVRLDGTWTSKRSFDAKRIVVLD